MLKHVVEHALLGGLLFGSLWLGARLIQRWLHGESTPVVEEDCSSTAVADSSRFQSARGGRGAGSVVLGAPAARRNDLHTLVVVEEEEEEAQG